MKPFSDKTRSILMWIAVAAFAIGIATLLNSCKTSSRLESSKQSISQTSVEHTTHATQQSQVAESVQVQTNIATDTEEVTTWFDTSKPADPATGKPPVAKQQIKKSKQTDNSKSDLIKNSGTKIDSGSTLKAKTKESNKEKTESSHASKALLSLPFWIYLAASALMLSALYFFYPPFKILIDRVFSILKTRIKKNS